MYSHKDIPVLLKNVDDDNVWKYMQYTGINSTNTNEPIYEGDILQCDAFWMGISEYSKGKGTILFEIAKYHLRTPECLAHEWYNSPVRYILGNIYEHPELLKSIEDTAWQEFDKGF